MINTLPYRLGVGLVIINDQSKIFTGRRLDSTKAWQMPQGGIDDNEIPLEAAYREMSEETGIEKCKWLFLNNLRFGIAMTYLKKYKVSFGEENSEAKVRSGFYSDLMDLIKT